MANGAPLGVADYKYGLRVSVIALKSPPQWLTKEGMEMGGPRAFGYVELISKPILQPKCIQVLTDCTKVSTWIMLGSVLVLTSLRSQYGSSLENHNELMRNITLLLKSICGKVMHMEALI